MKVYLVMGQRPTGRDKSAVMEAEHRECLVSFAEMSWGKTVGMWKLIEKMNERVESNKLFNHQERKNEH